ncbi:MAG: glycosyltransferase family 4 protein [Nitrospinaceae bacterium]|jgi:phosphatidyl-myo-inositol dimannoside synthase|nr:glycosyltransferase family 4 protein [Nitrospinaceae bacterium]MBT5369749.1 glycosyltransferase family 4 protein [Nitrospinaceae bacterium]MBT6395746.1 glycosyltransferase family 4 protein [Nitrospinaceae bacterium]
MAVLMLFPEVYSGTGGIQQFNREFIDAVRNSSFPARAVSLKDLKKDIPAGPAGKDEILQNSYCAISRFRIVWKIVFVLKTIFQALSFRPNIVVCGHIHLIGMCLFLNYFFGFKYIVIIHGIEVWKPLSFIQKKSIRNASLVCPVSRHSRIKITDATGIPESKTEILFNTVDGEVYRPGPKKKELLEQYGLEGKKVLLTVARVARTEKDKGFEVVLGAVQLLSSEFPELRYLIVGDGDYLAELKRKTEDLGILERVVFAGYVPDSELRNFYNLCDIFVMPSKKEGFGIVFLEALACGKPVIAGDRDGSRDPLMDGKLGQLVNPDDPEEVADAIRNIIGETIDKSKVDTIFLRKEVMIHYGEIVFKKKIKTLLNRYVQNKQ